MPGTVGRSNRLSYRPLVWERTGIEPARRSMQASVRTDPDLSDFHAAIQPVATGCLNGPFATGLPILFRYTVVAKTISGRAATRSR